MKKLFFALPLLCPGLFIKAQSGKPVATDNPLKNFIDSAVHEVVGSYLDSPAIGLSIGIYKNGKRYTYHYGEIEKGSHILPAYHHLYDIGSVAKVFTGLMLAKAVTEKKAKLRDDIRKYLPGEYPNLSYQGYPVKLVDLANHTSGLPELSRTYTDNIIDSILKLKEEGLKHFYTIYTADSLLKDMHHFTVDTLPGTRYRYNGNAMNVLQVLLERIYRQPFEEILTAFLQSHFRMNHTKLTLPAAEEKGLVQGYDETRQATPFVNFPGYRAAPGLNSTLTDMLSFIQANAEEILPAIRLSHQPTFNRSGNEAIGLGWMIEKDCKGQRMLYHSGRGSGITTLCTVYPEKRAGFIILVNNSSSEKRLFDLEKLLANQLKISHCAH